MRHFAYLHGFDDCAFIVFVAQQPRNVGHEYKVFSAERRGNSSGRSIGIDIVRAIITAADG